MKLYVKITRDHKLTFNSKCVSSSVDSNPQDIVTIEVHFFCALVVADGELCGVGLVDFFPARPVEPTRVLPVMVVLMCLEPVALSVVVLWACVKTTRRHWKNQSFNSRLLCGNSQTVRTEQVQRRVACGQVLLSETALALRPYSQRKKHCLAWPSATPKKKIWNYSIKMPCLNTGCADVCTVA